MKNKKGFTMVELLAVIVILGLLLIVAVPTVVRSMDRSRKKTFSEFADKVKIAAEQVYYSSGDETSGKECTVYDIKKDLNLKDVGKYNGYILIRNDVSGVEYYITMWDKDNMYLNKEFNNTIDPNALSKYDLKAINKESKTTLCSQYCLDTCE